MGEGWSPPPFFLSLGMLERKMMTQETLMNALREKGVRVCGTTKDFGIGGEGIWIAADSTPGLFQYDGQMWLDTFGVEPSIDKLVEDNGWYFEWYDPGTMMVWQN